MAARMPSHCHVSKAGRWPPDKRYLLINEDRPVVTKYGCSVAPKLFWSQRVATAYAVIAGPPTPAAAFIRPLENPKATMGTGPVARHELRFSRCDASKAMMSS